MTTSRPRFGRAIGLVAVATAAVAADAGGAAPAAPRAEPASAQAPVFSEPTRIDNPWLPLGSIRRSVLRGTRDGHAVRSVITPLDRRKAFRIHGRQVRALVVEDRAFNDGVLHEVALDYYAQADDGTVYYLGEDVDIYDKTGTRVVSHEGAFLYGRETDTLGVAMPADPQVGERYVFERIPGQGSESNRVLATDARLRVPAGRFRGVLKVRADHLPDREREFKWYVRGRGLAKEQGPTGGVELTALTRPGG